MVLEILTPTEPILHLHLPAELVGRRIEVSVQALDDVRAVPDAPAPEAAPADLLAARVAALHALAALTPLDLSNFVFSRDEATNYDGDE